MKEYQYKLPYDAKRRMAYFAFAAVIFSVAMCIIAFSRYNQGVAYPFTSLIPVLLLPILGYFQWKSVKKYASVYVIIRTEEDALYTVAKGLFELTITKQETKLIQKLPDNTLIVAKDARTRILIPHDIEGYEEIKQHIAGWAPMVPVKGLFSVANFYFLFPSVVFIVCLIGIALVKVHPYMDFFYAFGILSGLHTYYQLNKLTNVAPQVANVRWFVLFMVVLTCIKAYNIYLMP